MLSESSPDSGNITINLTENDIGVNVNQSSPLPNGNASSPASTNGHIIMSSPPAHFKGRIGDIDDDQIVALYGTLSTSANRSVRR